jgi:hypothetical protein
MKYTTNIHAIMAELAIDIRSMVSCSLSSLGTLVLVIDSLDSTDRRVWLYNKSKAMMRTQSGL